LKEQIEKHLSTTDLDASPLHVHVVADFRWLNDENWQRLPTISLGGPGVNALAHRWLEELPVTLAVDDRYYIQMDPELAELRASIWGMDNPMTQIAVSAFVQRCLSQFVDRCQTSIPDSSGLESDS
jgi:hypothetical protein